MSTAIALSFDGHPINILRAEDDSPLWLAKEVSAAVGYANSRQVADNIRRKWADELDEGVDYSIETAKSLKSFRCVNPTHLDFNPRGEIVLTESGLFGVINLAKTETGRRFRKWLRSEVLPTIARTGAYTAPTASPQLELFADTPTDDVKERRRQVEATAKARNAEARILAAELKEREARARYELDRMQVEAEVKRGASESKLRMALDALGPDIDTQTRVAVLGWAIGEDVTELKFAVAGDHLRKPPQPMAVKTLPGVSVDPRADWQSATAIAKQIQNPAVDAYKVASVAGRLGIKKTAEAHEKRANGRSFWLYSLKAVERIIDYISGGE